MQVANKISVSFKVSGYAVSKCDISTRMSVLNLTLLDV